MNSDDSFLLRLADLTADGEAGLRELILQQLAFARSHVVELPHHGERPATFGPGIALETTQHAGTSDATLGASYHA